ncbi:acetylxylan esterase [Microbacterium hydrocarbonoxydans]|uniref:acetylxylan esterase n=1 Tax=Microbacterium hydrocarbonoxydans TaxID=273678 RepID=UPI00203A647B|nr:acetylxylan esterase [Microbacterium hydrocarbonoxydans]MCM3779220.1 acetylxylan esterase [Microbacterium hydrocarbonoxydans]
MHGEITTLDAPTTQTEPDDFDAFWADTIAETRSLPLDVTVTPHPTRLTQIDVYEVRFRGFAGTPIRAWLRVPHGADAPLPGMVQFFGYGNGRGHALRDLRWAAAGYAHLVVDARGQGHGDTDDDHADGGPSAGGFLTRGLRSPHEYYYRRVYADAVRAVEALRSLDLVDPARVGVVGASQGGGIALAMAGLVPDLAVAVIQAPFLCELDRAATLSREHPYSLLTQYLADRRGDATTALDTLRYFDGVNHAKRANAPALLSTGMLDGIAPPETVLPAFSAYGGEKTVVLWPYNGHEAGGDLDEENALDFAAQHLAVGAPLPAAADSLR